MSRHLPECAGDDYCDGSCRCDGIPQPAILERASKLYCECDWRQLHHNPDCPDSPLFWAIMQALDFNPFFLPIHPVRIASSWNCVRHGLLGDINGPVHYEACNATN